VRDFLVYRDLRLGWGKDVPYCTHPLTVGLILARAGASEAVIIAGILHDTIEDCVPYGTVTKEIISERFGGEVAELVYAVTEKDKRLDWHERKSLALEEMALFSQDALLVKFGDVLSNTNEILRDYTHDGDVIFKRFGASREELINHSIEVVETILAGWPENPLAADLDNVLKRYKAIEKR
jgi:(p)ppGpp synthase/HD superfamily hydrolase